MADEPDIVGYHSVETRSQELAEALCQLLQADLTVSPKPDEDERENALLSSISLILDEYQQERYLLDPHLERLVSPILQALRRHIRQHACSGVRIERLTHVLYLFTKGVDRTGAHMTVRLFPHEVDDLTVLIDLFADDAAMRTSTWQIRFTLLLWLALVAMLPFRLTPEDKAGSASLFDRIQAIALRYISASSKERDAAVTLLARLYARNDADLNDLAVLALDALSVASADEQLSAAYMRAVCDSVKISSATKVESACESLYRLLQHFDTLPNASSSYAQRYRIKLAGRLSLVQLPHSVKETQDVPDTVEANVGQLLETATAKDTVVRWSSAKYLARVCERLPQELVEQVVSAVLEYFEPLDTPEDAAYEHQLHGACLSIAEMTRRKLVPEHLLRTMVRHVLSALTYDRKLGVRTVGINVRDSAAYVLWSVTRSLDGRFFSTNVDEIAVGLVSVALFDREVQIRRAASAAFQEAVGRWGTLPDGIDTLRTIDYVSISARHRAFLEAAPEVARREAYRPALVQHLLTVTAPHYDPELREQGAEALGRIVELDPQQYCSKLISDDIELLNSTDISTLHGALARLAAVLDAAGDLQPDTRGRLKADVLTALARLKPTSLHSWSLKQLLPRSLLAVAACAHSDIPSDQLVWIKSLLDLTSLKNNENGFASAGMAVAALSRVVDVRPWLDWLLTGLASRKAGQQQACAIMLGHIRFTLLDSDDFASVFNRLLSFVASEDKKASTIEGRRDGLHALNQLLTDPSTKGRPEHTEAFLRACVAAMDDYTVDQRGEVGSWVRLAALSSFRSILGHFSAPLSNDQDLMDRIAAGALKQALEKLDNVRDSAIETLSLLAQRCDVLNLRRPDLWTKLMDAPRNRNEWRRQAWAIEALMPFIKVPQYSRKLFEGALLGLNLSIRDSPLVDWILDLGDGSDVSLSDVMEELVRVAAGSVSNNRLMLPALGLAECLIANHILDDLPPDASISIAARLAKAASRSLRTIKSSVRVRTSIRLIVAIYFETESQVGFDEVAALLDLPQDWARQLAKAEMEARLALTEGDDRLVSLLAGVQ